MLLEPLDAKQTMAERMSYPTRSLHQDVHYHVQFAIFTKQYIQIREYIHTCL